MYDMSNSPYDFTREELKADEFVNLAQKNFRRMGFSIVSALGASPEDGRMTVEVEPLRVLDPVIWMIAMAPSLSERRSGCAAHADWVILSFLGGVLYGVMGGVLGGLLGGYRSAEVWALLVGGLFGLVGGLSGGQIAKNWKVLFKPKEWTSASWAILLACAGIGSVVGGIVGFVEVLLFRQ
jgi:hypothetical protein